MNLKKIKLAGQKQFYGSEEVPRFQKMRRRYESYNKKIKSSNNCTNSKRISGLMSSLTLHSEPRETFNRKVKELQNSLNTIIVTMVISFILRRCYLQRGATFRISSPSIKVVFKVKLPSKSR